LEFPLNQNTKLAKVSMAMGKIYSEVKTDPMETN